MTDCKELFDKYLQDHDLAIIYDERYKSRRFYNTKNKSIFKIGTMLKAISDETGIKKTILDLELIPNAEVMELDIPDQKSNDDNTEKQIDLVSEIDSTLIAINADLKIDTLGIMGCKIAGEETKLDNIINEIYLHRNKINKPKISLKDIEIVLLTYIQRDIIKTRREFKEKITHKPGLPNLFTDLLKHICVDKYDPWYDVLLYHHIWTIKRRLFGLPDYCPILLNFYGPAGCGKSEVVEQIFSIIPPILRTNPSSCSELFNEERQSFRFVDFCFMYMGELTGLDSAIIEAIKNRIDAKIISYRMFHTQKTSDGRNNATMVGTSNRQLKNIIVTDSDARKWAEIEVYEYNDSEIPEKMINPLKQFDWLTLWCYVNENGPSPFEDGKLYEEFRKWNTPRIITETPTVEFIKKMVFLKPDEFMSMDEIWGLYIAEVQDKKNKVKSKENLKELLRKYGFKWHGNKNGYRVPKMEECRYMSKDDNERYNELSDKKNKQKELRKALKDENE